MKIRVTDSANGGTLIIDTSNYVGDLPSDYGYENDEQNVTWVNWDYAAHAHDEMYDIEGVPEGQPLWVASGCWPKPAVSRGGKIGQMS